jgi:hypothetical protein
VPRVVVRSGLAFVIVTVVLAGSGCRDEAAERYARATLRYEALLADHTPSHAPAFDQVLADLDAVPPGSRHGAEAKRLATAIRLSRGPMVRTPLALGPKGGDRHPALEAKLAACARLAQLAGADGGVDRRALEALEACRHEAEVLELRLSHPDLVPDGGDHHP